MRFVTCWFVGSICNLLLSESKILLVRKADKIANVFDKTFRSFLSEAEIESFNNLISNEERAILLQPIYRQWLQPNKNIEVELKLNGDRLKIGAFNGWVDEF